MSKKGGNVIIFSRLGLLFVGLQIFSIALIPVLSKITDNSCSWICFFSQEQAYFLIFNLPGWFLSGIPIIFDFIKSIETPQQRLSGEITLVHNIAAFLLSAVTYYTLGLTIDNTWKKVLRKSTNNRVPRIFFIFFCIFVFSLFFVFLEPIVRSIAAVGQRIEQVQRCKNKDGFNSYESYNFRFEFTCKNWQYDGSYKVYENGLQSQEYYYKNGKMICDTQYKCYRDLK